MKPSEAS